MTKSYSTVGLMCPVIWFYAGHVVPASFDSFLRVIPSTWFICVFRPLHPVCCSAGMLSSLRHNTNSSAKSYSVNSLGQVCHKVIDVSVTINLPVRRRVAGGTFWLILTLALLL